MAKRVVPRRSSRVVPAVHARRRRQPDPPFERGLSAQLARAYDRAALAELYARFRDGEGALDVLMRRAIWRALTRRFGDGVVIRPGAGFRHPETMSIGDGVHLGDGALVHGRIGGRCVIGARTWIGPGCFLDARDLVIGAAVGLGPGVRVIGSTHTGVPADRPVIATDLKIAPVRIGESCDIGAGAVILPGVRIGRHCIVGAGAVVAGGIPAYAVAAGVPARIIRRRKQAAS